MRRSESLILADFASFDRVQGCFLNQLPLPIQVEDAWLSEGVKGRGLILMDRRARVHLSYDNASVQEVLL